MLRTIYAMIAIPIRDDYPRRPGLLPLLSDMSDIENSLLDAIKYKEWLDDNRKPLVTLEETK
mgnify:CR=1 FL=1